MTDYDTAFASFLDGCKKIVHDYYALHLPSLSCPNDWRVDDGKRYARIVFNNSAHCFVDKTSGAVLKPAGFKAPAKHARGNIYDEHNGLKYMGPHGPAYLR
jgi:hypothetical protein